jgi:hypothetical protein
MSSDKKPQTVPGPDERCGAKNRHGEPCQRWPTSDGNGDPINGRCWYHGGAATGPPDPAKNALDHGATASHETLREYLDDDDLEWIHQLAEGYREVAGLDPGDPRVDVIQDVCVASWQRWAARSEAIKNDLRHTAVVGTNEDGAPVRNEQEHYLGPAASRLSREIRQNLKELGILGDDSGTVDAKSAAQIIAAAVESSSDSTPHPQDVDASEDEPIEPPAAEGDGGDPASHEGEEEADPR